MSYLYHVDEGVLSLPDGFTDQTLNMFKWVFPEGECSLAIQRERIPANKSFAELVKLVTDPYPKQFPSYTEEPTMEIAFDLPTATRRFRWRKDSAVSYHHQVFVDLEGSLLLLTASGQARLREKVDDVLHEALSGLRLRERQ